MYNVYRMENKDGKGVYSLPEICPAQELYGAHPTPTYDSLFSDNFTNVCYIRGFDTTPYRFCFNSLNQWKRWFYNREWMEWAISQEVHLSIYEVDSEYVIQGTTQCTFNVEKAKLVSCITSDSLLELWNNT